MHIIYAASTCSDRAYHKLFEKTENKPAFQSQKYHRLLIEGLAAHVPVDVVANPPVNRSVMDKPRIDLEDETAGTLRYHYIPAIRHPLMKLIRVGAGTFWRTFRLTKKDSAVVVDCLNVVTALSALTAARMRGRPCVGIVTDLPDMLGKDSLFAKVANLTIRHCTHYVVLTEAMNDYLNSKGKPYVVLEGHADITMGEKHPVLAGKTKPSVCFYAGGVSKQYGLGNLVQGFQKANLENVQLHIYGPGDYVEELKKIATEDPNVFYGGMLFSSEIVEKEMEATLLVNPRPTNEEFVKYSFPSKTMEYMASGTPVLTTVLPGMPREYHPHVYLLRDETADGIAAALREIFSYTAEELFEKGQQARKFVLTERNNKVQAKRMLELVQ